MMRRAFVLAGAAAAFAAGTTTAAAAETPTVGTTTTTVCRFDPQTWIDAGTTSCNSDSLTISAGGCIGPGTRRYFGAEIFSQRVYQGLVIAPSTNGSAISGYEDVRSNARLVFDSGPHAAAGFSFTAADPSCT